MKKFAELSTAEQNALIEKYRFQAVNAYDWYEDVVKSFENLLIDVGFSYVSIYFSIGGQGSGACFTGIYTYEKGAAKKVKEAYPDNEGVQTFIDSLQEWQRSLFYGGYAEIYREDSHYSHEKAVNYANCENRFGRSLSHEKSVEFLEICRGFMRYIYKILENEYDYLTSDEVIKDWIEANYIY